MVYHFTVSPSGEFSNVVAAALAKARKDPYVIHLDRGRSGHLLLFCYTAELKEYVRRTYEAEKRVSAGVCFLSFVDGQVRVDLEGDADSAHHASGFVKWLLSTFGPCGVFDDDGDQEIGDRVNADPDVLFRVP